MQAKFAEVANRLENETGQLRFEMQLGVMEKVTPYYVDCETHKELCMFYNITAVPSFVLV